MQRAFIAGLALLSINSPALAYVETVCMSKDKNPIMVTVRADGGDVFTRAGDGPWVTSTSKVTETNGMTYVYVMATNERGTLVVRFTSEGGPSHIGFAFNNGRRSTYEATCVSRVRN